MMLRFLAMLAFLLFGASLCAAQGRDIPEISIDEARAYFSNQTHMTFDNGHGTQIEYLRGDGAAFLWYPGNAVIVPGAWKIEAQGMRGYTHICFRYGTNTYNPVTREAGGNWECVRAHSQQRRIVERAGGDVFKLGARKAPPFPLPRGRTTLTALRNSVH